MTDKEAIEFLKNISSEEASRCIGKDTFFGELMMYHVEALHLAIKALEERPKGKWIPVTERLPEDDEDVLVTRVYTESTHSFIDMVWFNKGKFLTQDGNLETSNVVAWMPLPEPYNER